MSAAGANSLRKIAQVVKSNGTEGEIIISLHTPFEDFKTDEPVYLIFDGMPVPFFIKEIRQRGKTRAIAKIEDIDSLEDADEIIGKDILSESLEDGSSQEDDLVGWILYDQQGYEVGTVTGFVDIPSNPCLAVEREGEEVYVPFHEDLILGADPDNREIQMDIPEGLLDL